MRDQEKEKQQKKLGKNTWNEQATGKQNTGFQGYLFLQNSLQK